MNIRGGALTALVLLVAIGCGGSDAPPNQGGGGGGGGGGVIVTLPDGGTIEAPAPPPPTLPGATPLAGVFVSSSKGTEGADGAMTRPVKTLDAAMQLARERKEPVIACAEVYSEAVTLRDGVTMYGYFDCSNIAQWKRVDAKAKIVSPTSPAVLAGNMVLPTAFAGFEIEAPDIPGTATGGAAVSSYGMIIRSSMNLTISEVSIRAGKGQDGVDGVEPAAGNAELSTSADGVESGIQHECNVTSDGIAQCLTATFVLGSAGGTSKCKVGVNGGRGGKGGNAPLSRNGQYAQTVSGLPDPASAVTAAGGTVGVIGLNPGTDGHPGDPGPNGAHGQWSFGATGFVAGNGTAGGIGLPGQGGGGGAGTNGLWHDFSFSGIPPVETGPRKYAAGDLPKTETWLGATGAGGGAGGCGGIAGTPGTGGGASIGLFIWQSTKIDIKDSRIFGAKGGRGGKGSLGTLGTPGRNGGAANPSHRLHGAAGGKGGDGGAAGLSGHGDPGPSIALAFSGARPSTVGVELVAGVPGDGAAALTRGTQTLPAVVGAAKAEHQF